MHRSRPAVTQPWWRRSAPTTDATSRARLVLHVVVMAVLLAAILAV